MKEKLVALLKTIATQEGKIARDTVAKLCPSCARLMESNGYVAVAPEILAERFIELKEQGMSQDMCDAVGGMEGFFTRCTAMIADKGLDDVNAFCAELHNFCHGKYPAQEQAVTGDLHEQSGAIFIAEASNKLEGKAFDVVLISAGMSTNKNGPPQGEKLPIYYSEKLLSDPNIVKMFEGVPAKLYEFETVARRALVHLPSSLRAQVPAGFPKNTVGLYENARFGEYKTPDGKTGKGILARLKVFDDKLATVLREAWNSGKRDLIGFSIDAVGKIKEAINAAGQRFYDVTGFDKLPEVTIVDNPAAGGHMIAMTASAETLIEIILKESIAMQKVYELFKKYFPSLVSTLKENATAEEVNEFMTRLLASNDGQQALTRLSLATEGAGANNGGQANQNANANANGAQNANAGANAANAATPAVNVQEMIEKISGQMTGTMEKLFEQKLQAYFIKAEEKSAKVQLLEASLNQSNLPAEERKELLELYRNDDALTQDIINRVIKRAQDKFAALQERGLFVPNQARDTFVFNKDQEDKWADALCGMLYGQPVNKVQPFVSLQESFSEITGIRSNREIIGRRLFNDFAHCFSPDPILQPQPVYRACLRERRVAMSAHLQEAALATTTWAEVFGDSIRRAMIMFYQEADWTSWRKIVSEISSASDFRTMRRVRIGGLADLETVAELGTYNEITIPGDEEETFVVTKKGNLFSWSMESAINDDLGSLKRIPQLIGRSAARTLYKSVFDIIRTNPTMGDGVALFHASHGNLGSSALSSASLTAAILAMRDQTELSSGEVLGNAKPHYIVYPNELEQTAFELASAGVSQVSDRKETINNWFLSFGLTTLPPIGYWTDANDWALIGDPMTSPTIEVSFFYGRQEPEILVQDQVNVGSMFTADKLSVKGRLIFGTKALDHRFMFKAAV